MHRHSTSGTSPSAPHPRHSVSISIPDLIFCGFPPNNASTPRAVSHRRIQSREIIFRELTRGYPRISGGVPNDSPFRIAARHRKYDSDNSTSYVKNGFPINITYVGGRVTGFESIDDVTIGGLKVTKQPFAEMVNVTGPSFSRMKFDGVLGMSYPMRPYNVPPVFDRMFDQHPNISKIFSFYLTKNESQPNGSELVIGGYDRRHYTGDITYTPVTRKKYWQFEIEKIQVNDTNKTTVCGSGCKALADTGNTNMKGPGGDVAKIGQAIGAHFDPAINRYEVNCSKLLELPDITFTLGKKGFVLRPSDYVQVRKLDGKPWCILGIAPIDPSVLRAKWIIGVLFMRRFYTVFDRGCNRVGFAVAA